MIDLEQIGQKAVAAKYELQRLTKEEKNKTLRIIAEELLKQDTILLKENQIDRKNALENGMHPGMVDRLTLSSQRIADISTGLLQVVALDDPIGEVLENFESLNGLKMRKVRVPMGVVGMIYESRPNVTADAFGLCFKTGNAVILKGGSDAIHSNIAIVNCIRNGLKKAGITEDALQLIEDNDRQVTARFMKLNQYVDVLIPRGGAGLIRAVVENSSIPVIETGTGNCHIYVDDSCDINMAISIILNAKTQRIGVCNSCESLVIHQSILDVFLPLLKEAFREKQVEIRGDTFVKNILTDCILATEEDYSMEYLDYIISIKTVANINEAIAHINQYNTKHSEAIITSKEEHATKFLNEVDAACVYVNASTRFTDGFEFGFGAEIGISTQKLHARGPMGLKELTSYKYQISGNGQIR